MTVAATPGILPNIRKMFVADPGHVIVDMDLSGADAQVVAWESGDEDLKNAFKKGLRIHDKNAADMWGEEYTSLPEGSPQRYLKYQQNKKAVHAFNYVSSERTVSIALGWSMEQSAQFKIRWFGLHPKIPSWHKTIDTELQTTRTITNIFGYRMVFFDRLDGALTDAVAWKPQSTVAICCERAAIQLDEAHEAGTLGITPLPGWPFLLLQVHDSLVFQIPKKEVKNLAAIRPLCEIVCPYPDDPLIIPWGIALSDRSWGDVKKIKWDELENWRP